jgi:hypothetical protein
MLVVTEAAESLQLLTIEEMRVAAGVTGSGSDDQLATLGLRISASITSECNIAIGSGAPPTLLRETLTQTYRHQRRTRLVLSRRHEIEVVSVDVDGEAVLPADCDVDPESGIMSRLVEDCPSRWIGSKIVVVYKAGFGTIPGDLKMAATDFFRSSWLEGQRDPALKGFVEDIPGVLRTETQYWVGSIPGQTKEGPVPDIVSGQLKRFRNAGIA